MSTKLIIFGFGGHARSIADVALSSGYKQLFFIDENAEVGENFLGHSVSNSTNVIKAHDLQNCHAIASSGNGHVRNSQCQQIKKLGLLLVSVISPTATIGQGSSIESGCFIGHHAHIGPLARIGHGCIINTGAVIEHESSVGDYSHVSVNSIIAGRSHLGQFSMLGANASIIDKISVSNSIVIGAGSVVISPIDQSGVYCGVPAQRIKNERIKN